MLGRVWRVQLPGPMRNIATLVGGSLVAVACFFFVSPANADPCEKGEGADDAECREYENYMVPGAQAVMYRPSGVEKPYFGGGFQLTLGRWSHQNDDFGPAEGHVFFQASLLQSQSSEHVMGIYEGGVTLSFEKNPKRRYLIPFFGFTTGAMVTEDLPKSGFVQPVAGIHLYSHHNVVADVQGGYVFPFEAVDDLHGFRVQAALRFHLW